MSYVIKRGWREITHGPIYQLFTEVIDTMIEDPDLWELAQLYVNDLPRLFVHKSTRSLGTCWTHKEPNGKYSVSILLSEYILNCPPEKIRATIVHEIGHMLAPKDKHGYYWRVRTNRLGRKWGYQASRLEQDAEMNEAMRFAKTAAYKYETVCSKCGQITGRYTRICDAVKNPWAYTHKNCGGHLISRTCRID